MQFIPLQREEMAAEYADVKKIVDGFTAKIQDVEFSLKELAKVTFLAVQLPVATVFSQLSQRRRFIPCRFCVSAGECH